MDPEPIPDGVRDAVATGLETYFTADAVHSLLEAIDIEELLDEEIDSVEGESIDSEEVGKVIGRLIGREVAKELTSYLPLGRIIETTVGNVVGNKLGEAAVEAFIEYGDPEAVANQVRTLADSTELERMATEITATAQEGGIQDYLPGLGSNAAETWNPDIGTDIEITDESTDQ
ncbi:hypothetical protein [Halocatena pleomorpha]|uniref:Uncharacterized protein n=1 Tax=Halocatena pleomorpha TaxID=1785090 RepID=A0A3P3REZ7_9EURY|nr:hypothetical protein [Halocatena pleomorpha]RRJ31548.1 hypothetical protein EIK79_07495 [Halocatena pleomorpha]